ncbi:MAG: manganese efflux pump MntP family protein, partial [Oscillospiraceae bacterium]|nr:manganese efflux pump MntP family protein [Oscillospiraceae bacterium]
YITAFDHIIALVLLGFIGGQMIWESFKKEDENTDSNVLTGKMLFMQGIATSIDALAVGVSFAALKDVNIAFAASAICCITFVFSIVGVLIGKKFGNMLNNKAQLVGGLILVGIGVKIFVEHTFFS